MNSWSVAWGGILLSLALGACAAPASPQDAGVDVVSADVSLDRSAPDVSVGDSGVCVDEDNDGHPSAWCGGDDCNDRNPRINPGIREVCDALGTDEDCDPCTVAEVAPNGRGGDGDVDEDGFTSNQCFNRVASDAPVPMCTAAVADGGAMVARVSVGDGEVRGTDCADNATNGGTRFPGATEQCNNLDDNCDGNADETPGLRSTYYRDRDGDGFGDRAAAGADIVYACSPPAGHVSLNTDCDDGNAMVSPGAREVCDPATNVDENCNGRAEEGCGCPSVGTSRACCSGRGTETCTMSGAGSVWGACTAAVSMEVCDGLDNDCDGAVDEGITILCYPDNDDDGFAVMGAAPATVCPDPARAMRGMCPTRFTRQMPTSATTSDCDDASPVRFPGNSESCNGVDDDCDLVVDEGLRRTYYRDADGDGFGDRRAMGGDVISACAAPMGFSLNNSDCNDSNAMVSPGAREVCDPVANVDENCNGRAEEGCGCPSVGTSRACCSGRGTETCTMSGAGSVWGACTAAVSMEVCDGLDNDCNGTVDEGLLINCFVDNDNDGFAAAGATTSAVCPDSGRVAVGSCPMRFTNRAPTTAGATDCDDTSAARFPANPDRCDGVDNDCDPATADGSLDPALGTLCGMGSGVGRCATGRNACVMGAVTCRPSTPVLEMCNGADDDCDGMTDEGFCVDATLGAQGEQSPPRGYGVCVSTAMGPACAVRTCAAEYDNCDGNATNGCEAALRTDPNHCGACGNRCVAGACVAGSCTASPTSVSAGRAHACARLSSGAVACWGANASGQLGDGTTMTKSAPALVVGLSDAVEVVAGGDHTCARRMNGTVVCWGANASGQLGNGTMTNSSAPVAVTGLTNAAQLSVNSATSCARRTDGTVVCWGANASGQLGDNTTTTRSAPVVAMGLSNVRQISVGDRHVVAVRMDGAVFCWGNNGSGACSTVSGSTVRVPTMLSNISATKAVAGAGHTCVLRTSGVVSCFGDNVLWQLGASTPSATSRTPVNVTISNVADIETRANHTCARLTNNLLRCWGNNRDQQLGNPSFTNSMSITPQEVSDETSAQEVTTGGSFTCGRWESRVFCWGANGDGQLGDGATSTRVRAAGVRGFSTSVSLGLGEAHSCATLPSGAVRCWGASTNSETGYMDRPLGGRTVPMLTDAFRVANGSGFSCALRSGGAVVCWGGNASGQLGNGTMTASASPVVVTGLSDVVEVEAGSAFACARTRSGSVSCWGANTNGQLGNGTTTSSAVPVAATGLTNAIDISLGARHACARRSDHSVVCWGDNGSGQLGDGTLVQRTIPTAVTTLAPAADLAAGDAFTCARVLSDGATFCWGSNGSGQLGNGTMTATRAPVRSNAPLSLVELRAGSSFACGRLAAGTVVCWGENSSGQLGNRGRIDSSSPVAVQAVSSVVALELGGEHACARQSSGDTICWGQNIALQVGVPTWTFSEPPARVTGM